MQIEESGAYRCLLKIGLYTLPVERVVGTEMNTQDLTLGFRQLKVEQKKVTAEKLEQST